jgi:hypothetical protein
MPNDIELFYLNQEEPTKSCFLLIRELILGHNSHITEAWKYRMPFFCYKGKMFCYVWTHKKTQKPFIGFVEGKRMQHPLLTFEDRSRIKIMLLDPEQDLPVDEIKSILQVAVDFVEADLK